MKLRRRTFLHLAAGVAALPAASRVVRAQAYPSRPVRIIVGFAAASGSDILARLMATWLQERFGQTFIVENRAGGGGNPGTEAVVKAPPDGYTLLKIAPANTVNDALYEKLSFNFIRDIEPIAGMARVPYVLVVNQALPVKTVPDLIAYAAANPGKLNFGSAGVGSGLHMSGELFKMMAGVQMVHVPYRGAGLAMTDLIGGRLQLMFDSTQASIPHIKAGNVRALAATTATRSPALPDLPAIGEFVPGYEFERLVRLRRAAQDAARDRREAQQGNKRHPGRSESQGAHRRAWRRGPDRLAGRLWPASRRGSRQVGQGSQGRQYQGVVGYALAGRIP